MPCRTDFSPARGRNRLLALAGGEAALPWAGGPVPQAATPTINGPHNNRPGGTDPRTRRRVAYGLLQRVARSPIPAQAYQVARQKYLSLHPQDAASLPDRYDPKFVADVLAAGQQRDGIGAFLMPTGNDMNSLAQQRAAGVLGRRASGPVSFHEDPGQGGMSPTAEAAIASSSGNAGTAEAKTDVNHDSAEMPPLVSEVVEWTDYGEPVLRKSTNKEAVPPIATVKIGRRYMNVPTVIHGKQLTIEEAVRTARAHGWFDTDTGRKLKFYDTWAEATHTPPTGTDIDTFSELRSRTAPVATGEDDRRLAIINDLPVTIEVANNKQADSSRPLHTIDGAEEVTENDATIEKTAKRFDVDPDLVRAVIWLETTQGWYDRAKQIFDAHETIRPMNVHARLWQGLGYSREDLKDPVKNIEAGVRILKGLQDRMPGASMAQIATAYNYLGATKVNDYGARVAKLYKVKPWAWDRSDPNFP